MADWSGLWNDLSNLLATSLYVMSPDGHKTSSLSAEDAFNYLQNGSVMGMDLTDEPSGSVASSLQASGSVQPGTVWGDWAIHPNDPLEMHPDYNLPSLADLITLVWDFDASAGGRVAVLCNGIIQWIGLHVARYADGIQSDLEQITALLTALGNEMGGQINYDDIISKLERERFAGECTLIGGLIGLGAGEVLTGIASVAAVGEIIGAVVELLSVPAIQAAEKLLDRAEELREKGGCDYSQILARLGSYDSNLSNYLDENLVMAAVDLANNKVVDCLSQASVLIDGTEHNLLAAFYVDNKGVPHPLSEGLRGVIYNDSQGLQRHAIATLLQTSYHEDVEGLL